MKYDEHRKFLEGILENMNRSLEELQTRAAILEDQIHYIEDAIQALNVFEHIPNKE